MKKILGIMLFVTASSYAALQYNIVTGTWSGSVNTAPITLQITEGGSLWFSSFVSNWYSMTDLGDIAQMTAGNYGTVANGTTAVAGTGEAQTVTFSKHGNSVSGTGYFAGNFDAGDSVSFWITTNNDIVGSSVGPTSSLSGQLQSRMINLIDLAGNTRINFGFDTYGSVEMVASGGVYYPGSPSGQPLPGAFVALLVGGGAMGSLTFARRKRA